MMDLIKQAELALKEMLTGSETARDKATKVIKRIGKLRHCCELECGKIATIHIEFSDKTEDSSDFCDSCIIRNIPKGTGSWISPILN